MERLQPNFEAEKRRFFVQLALRHRSYFQPHRESGQTERYVEAKAGEMITVFTSKGKEILKKQRWGNPTEHCLVETAVAEDVAKRLQLSKADGNNLVIAALIHDWRKRGEIEETRGVTDPKVIEASYRKSKDELRQYGIPQEAVDLTECVAHTSLPRFARVNEDNSLSLRDDIPVVEMAMHYIDDITKGTDIVTLDKRMDYLDDAALEGKYPYNDAGKDIWGGRTFFQAQREIGHLIEDQLAAIIGIDNPRELPLLLQNSLMENIASS